VTTSEGDRRADHVPSFWAVDSSPFSALPPGTQPCRIVLRQVDDNDFALVETLVLMPPVGMPDPPDDPLVVGPTSLVTDLASIPSFFGWFARRHGRHTPAAIVHDHLIREPDEPPQDDLPTEWRLSPERADALFLTTLVASGVPPVRSYLMWSAVTARTRWKTVPRRKVALAVWGLSALMGTMALVVGAAQRDVVVAGVALVAPVPAALLWGRQYRAGLVAGYAVWWSLVGAVPAWVAYKLYEAVEGLVWLVRRWRRRGAAAPADDVPPPPVSYRER
jgi:hypothetical protein